MENPYAQPTAHVTADNTKSELTAKLASGQKLVIYAILLYFLAGVLNAAGKEVTALIILAAIIALTCIVMGCIGIFRIGAGLGYSTALRIFLIILMIIPLAGLITLLVLNSKATNRLKAAGYSVGLLGARS